jgi:hypothetical protein
MVQNVDYVYVKCSQQKYKIFIDILLLKIHLLVKIIKIDKKIFFLHRKSLIYFLEIIYRMTRFKNQRCLLYNTL